MQSYRRKIYEGSGNPLPRVATTGGVQKSPPDTLHHLETRKARLTDENDLSASELKDAWLAAITELKECIEILDALNMDPCVQIESPSDVTRMLRKIEILQARSSFLECSYIGAKQRESTQLNFDFGHGDAAGAQGK